MAVSKKKKTSTKAKKAARVATKTSRKKASPAQLAQRKKFKAATVRAKTLSKKRGITYAEAMSIELNRG